MFEAIPTLKLARRPKPRRPTRGRRSSSLAIARFCCIALAAWLAGLTNACSSGCDPTGQSPVRYESGNTNSARTYYESSGWNDEYLDFPSGRVYEFVHHLRSSDFLIKAYLAFSAHPLAPGQVGDVAESAGNQVIYEAVGPDSFRVRNDTCAHFYLRVVAFGVEPELVDAGSPGAAGNDGG